MNKCLNLFYFVITFHTLTTLHAGWAEDTLAELSLDEKIGQLIMTRAYGLDEESLPRLSQEAKDRITRHSPQVKNDAHIDDIEDLIKNYHVGNIIFFQGLPDIQVKLINQYQKISKLPLLVGADYEWGLGMRLQETLSYPKNKMLATLNDAGIITDVAREIGRQSRIVGVHIPFAPVVDINTNPHNPVIGSRAFGDTPEVVTSAALAFQKGIKEAGALSCAKHFPDHGNTSVDSHCALPVVKHSLETFQNCSWVPYKAMIKQGLEVVMVGHMAASALDDSGYPASLSHNVVTGILRSYLGFNGLIITDSMRMKGVITLVEPEEAAVLALIAGNDIILDPINTRATIKAIKQAVKSKRISEVNINERVLRILKVKESLNLHANRFVDEKNVANLTDNLSQLFKTLLDEKIKNHH
jgi:beta-N-acetylhexosaminidase